MRRYGTQERASPPAAGVEVVTPAPRRNGVFATQAPKGLHNQIPGNAATQFFGFLNSPVQISAAREMAQAKGSDVPDISRMKAGQFYAAREGLAFEKLQAPFCLSYHPKSALTAEEVVIRARRVS